MACSQLVWAAFFLDGVVWPKALLTSGKALCRMKQIGFLLVCWIRGVYSTTAYEYEVKRKSAD